MKQRIHDLMWEHLAHPVKKHVCQAIWDIPHITSSWRKAGDNQKDKGTILIIQGHYGTFYGYRKMGDFLHRSGYKVYYLNVPVRRTFDPIATIAARYVKFIEKELTTEQFSIIGHSKGGLVAKYLISQHPHINDRVKKIITLATPHNGTRWGYAQLMNLKELVPKSGLIRSLSSPAIEKKVVSIHNSHDQYVSKSSARIKHGENHIVDVWGHKQILFDERTTKLILDILES